MSELNVYYYLTRPAAVLRATGPDAFAFLQSQFSNDLEVPGVEQPVTYGLWLDHKGKIQADSFVIQKAKEDFLLMSYDCPAAILKGHLEAHLIADEVELRDETAAFGLLHTWPEIVQAVFPKFRRGTSLTEQAKVPDAPKATFADFQAHMESLADPATCDFWMGRRPQGQLAWDYLAAPAELAKLIHELTESGAEAAGTDHLHTARILAGIPSVPQDAGPGDLPQEAGLARDGVSFDKGCFLGQEVMSRLHTQGHVNRGLWHVGWDVKTTRPADESPVPLYIGADTVGELRSRVITEEGGVGLAMLKKRAVLGNPMLSLTPNGPKVVRLMRDLTEG